MIGLGIGIGITIGNKSVGGGVPASALLDDPNEDAITDENDVTLEEDT